MFGTDPASRAFNSTSTRVFVAVVAASSVPSAVPPSGHDAFGSPPYAREKACMNAYAASKSPVPAAGSHARAAIAAAPELACSIRLRPSALAEASGISRAVTSAGVTPSVKVTGTIVDAPIASLTRRYSSCVPAGSVKRMSARPLAPPVTSTASSSSGIPPDTSDGAGPYVSWYRTPPSGSVHPVASTARVSISSTGDGGESLVRTAIPPVGGALTRATHSAKPLAPVAASRASHRNAYSSPGFKAPGATTITRESAPPTDRSSAASMKPLGFPTTDHRKETSDASDGSDFFPEAPITSQ
mmetsp:Transcript_6382/g.24656  ORF Transcript_6382/g.24656 Transcript_6382/m.24656 type:complete len:300 (-) Transcript_6382:1462-2361(-)